MIGCRNTFVPNAASIPRPNERAERRVQFARYREVLRPVEQNESEHDGRDDGRDRDSDEFGGSAEATVGARAIFRVGGG